MGSKTKFTKIRRRMKAAKKVANRAKKSNKLLLKLKKAGLNPVLAV